MDSINIFDVIIIGAGPAGISIIGALLNKQVSNILWIDPSFTLGDFGRLSAVPANTRVCNLKKFIYDLPEYNKYVNSQNCPLKSYDGLPND